MSGIKQQDKAITLLINNTENNNTNENFIYLALESTLPTLQDKQLKYREKLGKRHWDSEYLWNNP